MLTDVDNEKREPKDCICGQGFGFSPEIDKIVPAFIATQGLVKYAKKGAVNPFLKDDKQKKDGKYTELSDIWEVIKEPMQENKLCIMWFITTTGFKDVMFKNMTVKTLKGSYGDYEKLVWDGTYINVSIREIVITTMLLHESGQHVKTWLTMTPDGNGSQAKGASITYGKRYAVASLFGVCPEGEDTDGNPRVGDKRPEPDKSKTKQELQPPKLPDKPKPETEKKEYQKDKNGVVRYNKTDNTLNDRYQTEHGFVITEQLKNIHELVKYNLGGKFDQFYNWLFDVYKVVFWDIKQNMIAGIMQTLSNDSKTIMDHKKCTN